jgi:hypothetical protein
MFILRKHFPKILKIPKLAMCVTVTVSQRFLKHSFGFQSGGYEDFCLMGCNAVQSVENQPMFRMNTSPPSSFAFCLLHAGFLLGLFFNPEDGSDMFLRNVSRLSANYTSLYYRR